MRGRHLPRRHRLLRKRQHLGHLRRQHLCHRYFVPYRQPRRLFLCDLGGEPRVFIARHPAAQHHIVVVYLDADAKFMCARVGVQRALPWEA